MPKCGRYHAKWKANIAKCSKYHAKCKVTMPKCSKYHAEWQVLVPNCCKFKANCTRNNQNKFQNLRPKKYQKHRKTILHPFPKPLVYLYCLYYLYGTCQLETMISGLVRMWHVFRNSEFPLLQATSFDYCYCLYHTYISICIPLYMYVCMDGWMNACMYVCMHVCMYVCIYVCMYVCVYVYVCMCVYVCMYVYHTHSYSMNSHYRSVSLSVISYLNKMSPWQHFL